MKAKELISELQKLVDKNGDLEVDFVSSFFMCTCGDASIYCYCSTEDYEFNIESVNKRTFPKCGKMSTVGIVIRGSRD